MEFAGILKFKIGERCGVSKTGQEWKIAKYLVETVEMYPRRIVFEVSNGNGGQERVAQFDALVGQTVRVYFDIDAREYNGEWYNSVHAYKAIPLKGAAKGGASDAAAQPHTEESAPSEVAAAQPQTVQNGGMGANNTQAENGDDIPF